MVQASIVKWDDGNAFLRWMSALGDVIGALYESYFKQEVGNVTGSVGDGYLKVDVRFVDKRSGQPVGQITLTGLADDPNNVRSAEDRVVNGLVRYVKSRL